MKISIFGLGYVGTVSSACFADKGHEVVGVDPLFTKVELINSGNTPIIEDDIGSYIRNAYQTGRLRATTDPLEAIVGTDISFICVGTPSKDNGDLNLGFVQRVCEHIGSALARKDEWHLVVVRSTVLPGTMRSTIIPILEKTSGKVAGKDFGICHNPEFLREGSAVFDFFHPPKTIIGGENEKSLDVLASLYADLEAPIITTSFEISEMVKYVDNVWHGLKVCFANEIGNICKSLRIDSHKVMDIFCKDTKLNISPSYLKPGFAFGGSCLPKDIRAFRYTAKRLDTEIPIIDSILTSNFLQIERALKIIVSQAYKNIGVLGFSFKSGTDDLRESPMVELIERLIGKGYFLKIYDKNVRLASLIGANKEYILNKIPHVSKLMVDEIESVIRHADMIIIGNSDEAFSECIKKYGKEKKILDLVRLDNLTWNKNNYDGICW